MKKTTSKKDIIYFILFCIWILVTCLIIQLIFDILNFPFHIIYLIIFYFSLLVIGLLLSFIFEINFVKINYFILFLILFFIFLNISNKDFWTVILIWYFMFYGWILIWLLFMAAIKWGNKTKKENKENKKDSE